jgi:uncharacterized protein involved in exopolysaccharide biosynthesis
VRLESRLDQSNIAILNTAVPPMKVARPKLLLNLALALVLGPVLGIAVTLARELRDPRVRSVADVRGSAGIEVLVELPPYPAGART